MEGLSIDAERIVATGGGVTAVGESLAREIATMGDLLAEIRTGWQSEQAAPRFAASMQGYLEQATTLKNALVSHGATLTASGQRFAAAEAALAGGIPVVGP